MKKMIEKHLAYYKESLENGDYALVGIATEIPKRGFFRDAFMDVKDGEVTDIRIYVYMDAYIAGDWPVCAEDTLEVTAEIEEYLEGESWEWLVDALTDVARELAQ